MFLTGGGIRNYGILTLNSSTVSGNTGRDGGGISIHNSEQDYGAGVTINFSTIYSNIAISGDDLSIKDTDLNGKVIKQISQVTIRNSIVVGDPAHLGPDMVGRLISDGHNLFQSNSGATFDPFSKRQHNTDKLLSTDELAMVFATPVGLRDNGGHTKTLALAPDSPVVDQIPLAVCHVNVPVTVDASGDPIVQSTITTDQRGVKRPDHSEDKCDIGAYEYVDESS
jgi:hypothetical protein